MSFKTYSASGVVLKRVNFGEADRLVTVFTEESGKVIALAKGVRRLTSSRKGALEPAAYSRFFFATGKNLDILTQAQLINSFFKAHDNLIRLTQTVQLLEIVDLLTAEKQAQPEVFALLIETLANLETNGHKKTYLLEQIRLILKALGFTHDKVFTELELKAYIEDLSQKRLRTKDYLSTANS